MNLTLSIWILTGVLLQSPDEYRVGVIHPGIDRIAPVSCTITGIRDTRSNLIRYHMEVESVVCGKTLCKVVPVNILWNELGIYERFDLSPGILLEKDKGKPFTSADYRKLDRILTDSDSPFSRVDPEQIIVYEEDDSSLDGITGATMLIDSSANVQGAVLTCYTLWHWVNGSIREEIRRISGDDRSLDELRFLLGHEEYPYREFALEQLHRRRAFDGTSMKAVGKMALEEGPPLFNRALNYYEDATPEAYFRYMETLLRKGAPAQRIGCLRSLMGSEIDPPQADYYDQLSRDLAACDTYQEVDLMLKLMIAKNPGSREVIRQVVPLLERDILIARRAFWFLSEEKLSESQEQQLETFRKKFSDYL